VILTIPFEGVPNIYFSFYMKKNTLLVVALIMLCSITSYAQHMLVQGIQNIYLVNYQTNESVKLDLPQELLVGYQVQDDSLVILLSSGYGRISSHKYYHEWLGQVIANPGATREIVKRVKLEWKAELREYTFKENLADTLTENADIIEVNVIDVDPNLRLAVDKCGNLEMLKDGKSLWTFINKRATMGLYCYTKLKTAGTVRLADEKILFVRERDTMLTPKVYKVVEIDKLSGKSKEIVQSKSVIEASYSPDEKYIFYNVSKKGYATTYRVDRATGKKKAFKLNTGKYDYHVERVYWIN
jgi:hypothetical protein